VFKRPKHPGHVIVGSKLDLDKTQRLGTDKSLTVDVVMGVFHIGATLETAMLAYDSLIVKTGGTILV
jgi:hypothetical protein